ncbi:MAG: hypothetical protein KJ077_10620 [Anaerolineae bacterium]|nr:hypothetical protein [Anaerolineae bacterium]
MAALGGQKASIIWSYRFIPVTDGSIENRAFWAATPSGEIKLSAIVDDLFTVGQEYYLDFVPAPAPAEVKS